MNRLLEALGGLAAKRHWMFIFAWLVIFGGALGANHFSGGSYVNNYTVPGTGFRNPGSPPGIRAAALRSG